MPIKISEISIVPMKPQGSFLGFVGFVIDGIFYVGGVGIHSDAPKRSIRLVYPSKKLQNGQEIPLFHPIGRAVGDFIQQAVIAEWERLIK